MVRQLVSPKHAWLLAAVVVAAAVAVMVFRLGSQASAGVDLNAPIVWLEDGQRGEVLQVNGATKEVTARIQLSDRGDSVVVAPRGRDAVFLNRTTGELGVIGAVSLRVDFSEQLSPTSGPVIGDDLQLKADFTESTDAYIIDDTRTLVVEPGAGIRLPIPTPEGIGSSVVRADGRLLAVTADGRQIGITAPQGLVPLAELPEPVESSDQRPALARAGGEVYAVDVDRRSVRAVADDGSLGTTTCVAGSLRDVLVGGTVLTGAGAPPRILAHDPVRGELSISEPERSECYTIEIDVDGTDYGAPVAVDSMAYLPNYSTGRIVIVDMESGAVSTVPFGPGNGTLFELEVFGSQVWANEPQGPTAAILSPQGIELVRKLGRVVINDGDDGDDGAGTFISPDSDSAIRGFGEEGEAIAGAGGLPGLGDGDDGDNGDTADPFGTDELLPDDSGAVGVVFEDLNRVTANGLLANFTFTADTVSVGEVVNFVDQSSGDPVAWNWDFGDGTGAEGPEVQKSWETEGIYTVRLFIADELGNSAQQSVEITVVAADTLRIPQANFRFRSDTVEVGEALEFESLTSGEIDLLTWNFGDGNSAFGERVEHTYEEIGTYRVELTASNGAGDDTTSAEITVVEAVKPPEAIIATFPTVLEVGQSVILRSESTNSPTSLVWDFGDGETALGSEVRHAWDRPDTYRVRLTVSNSAGESSTFRDVVITPRLDPPIARFGESSLEAVVGEPISFTDLSQNQPTRISWEFGDGDTATGSNVTHRWERAGQFTVTMTVSNDAGSDDVSKTVTILPLPPDPPVASFTFDSATVPVNSVVKFKDRSTNDPTEWSWDFGDGSTSSAKNPPHAFAEPGSYEVTLIASNAGGSDSVSQTVVVIDPPVASFEIDADELSVTFIDTSSNEPTSWMWDFGDGETSTAQSPTKVYASPGTYIVTLVASNAAGSSAPQTRQLTVARRPNPDFEIFSNGLTVEFTDISSNGPTSWTWEFGDGTTSTSQNPTHQYEAPGEYEVRLVTANVAGQASTTREIEVDFARPVAVFECQAVGASLLCDGSASSGAAEFSWRSSGDPIVSGEDTSAATFTYDESDTYRIRLVVRNGNGDRDVDVQDYDVVVPEPPEVTNVTVVSNEGGEVELRAQATNSPTTWSWRAPDAIGVSGGGTNNPTFVFDEGGLTSIFVIAGNDVGDSPEVRIRVDVNILNPPVITAIDVLSNSLGIVDLRGTATNNPTSWVWNVPDGTIQSGGSTATPTVQFPGNGNYVVRAQAENADGRSDVFQITVAVTDFPDPPVVTDVNEISNAGGVVQMEGVATNAPTQWQWRIDGQNYGSATPTFTLDANGTYVGDVRARNISGWSPRVPFTVVVDDLIPPPQASFTAVEEGSLLYRLVNTSIAQPNAVFTWTGIDPDWIVEPGDSPLVLFPGEGEYTITLTVVDAGGSDSDTDVVDVE